MTPSDPFSAEGPGKDQEVRPEGAADAGHGRAVLVQGRLAALKELAGALSAVGIEAEIVRPPASDPNG